MYILIDFIGVSIKFDNARSKVKHSKKVKHCKKGRGFYSVNIDHAFYSKTMNLYKGLLMYCLLCKP